MGRANSVAKGNLDLMVLGVLSDKPKYGYLIQQRLNQVTGGEISIAPGTLYPLLHRLESEKLVKARWDDSTGRRRKWYELTAKGQKRLDAQAMQWRQMAQWISELLGIANPSTG
jgi:PadR family transcriptional regulator, regulatory protein PadR